MATTAGNEFGRERVAELLQIENQLADLAEKLQNLGERLVSIALSFGPGEDAPAEESNAFWRPFFDEVLKEAGNDA